MSAMQMRTTAMGQTQATMTAYLDALFGGGRYGDYLASDATFTMMETGEVTQGREAIVGLIDYIHEQAFAATSELTTLVAGEERAMIEAVFIGQHAGEFAGIAPTGRAVRLPYTVAYDLDGDAGAGVITALRVYLSLDALVRQIRGA